MEIVNIYSFEQKKQSIIKSKNGIHSDFISDIANKSEIIDFVIKNEKLATYLDGRVILLEKGKVVKFTNGYVLHIDQNKKSTYYSTSNKKLITVGATQNSDIILKSTALTTQVVIELGENEKVIYPSHEYLIYVNNIRVSQKTTVNNGDQIDISGLIIIPDANSIQLVDYSNIVAQIKLVEVEQTLKISDAPVEYKRSPRLIINEPDKPIKITMPPNEPQQSNDSIIKVIVPPLSMAAVTVVSSMVMARNSVMVIVMMLGTAVSIITSVVNFIKQRKQIEKQKQTRKETYTNYLKQKINEIAIAVDEQIKSRDYHFPDNAEILKMAENVNRRQWEKAIKDDDFLSLRIGTGNLPLSFKIEVSEKDFSEKDDPLEEQAISIRDRFNKRSQMPRSISLKNGAVGLLGYSMDMKTQVSMLINQIAYFHSYHDVEIFHIYAESEHEYWEDYNYLPHVNSQLILARSSVYDARTQEQVLSSIFQVIKERQKQFDETRNGGNYTPSPHIVFFISDMNQIIDHGIMEYLADDLIHLGIHLIYIEKSIKNLPEYVKTIVEYKNDSNGRIITDNGEYINEEIFVDKLENDFPNDKLSRILSGYDHVLTLKSSIPEKVGFLELFEVNTVEELNIAERWEQNEPRKTLAVPLGYRGPGDIVNLNLHEKAHGPHGLVAGTTGSGKSEIVQSYILGLAANFHPHQVGLLLIDYKGGGMANLFKNLPHLMGTITNLDGAQSMRALTAIKAELLRRQRVFGENDVNHIDGYQKLFKEGKVSEPMPHLFMISDEFAELKSEQPEFIKELVSAARIGRSLGVHLILATQKPSGVVDDQIWSNSKFKLCLKVQNVQDSNEMLKTPDAAAITLPGRAYLQVGNNEIYELFQSAYSGTTYTMGQIEEKNIDRRIYKVNPLGQYELLTTDLSQAQNDTKSITELEAVTNHIAEVFEKSGAQKVPDPWLAPLDDEIVYQSIDDSDFKDNWAKAVENSENMEMLIGRTDEPENQAQNDLSISLESGHIGVYGSGGFGKTTMLKTMISNLIRKNRPDLIKMYILDFGQGLLSYKNAPHVADLITIDESEKIEKWTKLIDSEVKQRRRLFKQYSVADITAYREISGQEIKRIFIFLDNYDAIKDLMNEKLDAALNLIAREGVSLGIHLVISASRSSSVRYNMSANIKEKITLYQLEHGEISSIVGRTTKRIQEIPGRGLIKLEDATDFQTVIPNEATDNSKQIKLIREEIDLMNEAWKGERHQSIPVIPETLDLTEFRNYPTVAKVINSPMQYSIGVDFEKVESITIDINEVGLLNVLGSNDEIARVYKTIINTASDEFDFYMINNGKFKGLKNLQLNNYSEDNEEGLNLMREQLRKYLAVINDSADKNDLKPTIFFFSDINSFTQSIAAVAVEQFEKIFKNAIELKATFIFGSDTSAFATVAPGLVRLIKQIERTVVLGQVGTVSKLNITQSTFREPEINPGEANYVENGKFQRIKLVDNF